MIKDQALIYNLCELLLGTDMSEINGTTYSIFLLLQGDGFLTTKNTMTGKEVICRGIFYDNLFI